MPWLAPSPAPREFIKGLRRSLRDQPQKRAPPVLQDALRQLVSVFAEPTALHARNRAILIIGWFGAMRRSEIVALDRDDVRETKDGLVVTIRHSKTDQTGRGQVLGLPRRDDALCPVAALRAWLAVADAASAPNVSDATRGGPLFVAFSNRCRGQRLKPQAVELVMAEALAHTGLADAFTPHSLRAGFATAAARAGKPIFAIQRQTRHKSIQMLERYVREGEVFSQNAAGGL